MTNSSVRRLILAGAVAATATALAAVFVAAEAMWLSGSERNLMLVVLVAAFGLAVLVAVRVSRPLVDDLDQLASAARQVAAGDLSARSGVERRDEVGATARSFDEMVGRLELAERRREAEEAERRLLFASVGHDLRTPLAAIRAAVEALQDGVAPDPARYLVAIGREAEHLGRLTEDLFLLAQIDAGRFEVGRDLVDVAEVVDESAEALLPSAAARGVSLDVVVAIDPGASTVVRGTSHHLGRVVRNLLDNAIRHAGAPGVVTVTVGVDPGSPIAEVVVTVLDDGPGFPAGFIDKATEAFSRADASRDRSRGGAGLGLAIVRGVTEAHGGSIEIGRGPGGEVAVSLPAVAHN
ncbi:MAG: HAMP domain-containing histidine kinase [Actinomycetia bacterium]|nr:HAMP domain-containing histidine kinase [Actinomycetes bacterium]MCP4958500.1 HAMP domain-containing histidine kinase [Actinomycetes bacterium]